MTIIGIDPGATSGAWCSLACDHHGSILNSEWATMPEMYLLADLLEVTPGLKHVIVEKAQTMPNQGGVSTFRYGAHYGTILGILIALKLPHTLVHPSHWTRIMHAGTKTLGKGRAEAKKRSLEAALRLFPERDLRATPRSSKPHDGIIDAMLIAEYGRRHLFGGSKGELVLV